LLVNVTNQVEMCFIGGIHDVHDTQTLLQLCSVLGSKRV
jgi:hypothetical protein